MSPSVERPLAAHLWVNAYLQESLLEVSQLSKLHRLISQLLPTWSQEVRVARGEGVRKAVSIGSNGSLAEAINKVAPPKFGLGRAVIAGAYDGLLFMLSGSRSTLPPELNHLSVEIVDLTSVEGCSPWGWAALFLEHLVGTLPVRYANVRLDEEFNAKNLKSDETGVRAVGVHLSSHLPGLYWLNFLGAPYAKLIGETRLRSVPALNVRQVGGGLLFALGATPLEWAEPAYREREAHVTEHIGPECFFSSEDPDRCTIAPDFRAERRARGDDATRPIGPN